MRPDSRCIHKEVEDERVRKALFGGLEIWKNGDGPDLSTNATLPQVIGMRGKLLVSMLPAAVKSLWLQ